MKRNSILIFLSALLIWVSMYVYVPVLPTYATSLGASHSMVGLISGVYGALPVFLCALLGFVAGSHDRAFLVVGFAIASLSALIFLLNRTVSGLLIGRAVAAAASSWWVVIAAAYSKYQPEDREVRAQGVLNFGSNFGKMIACALCMAVAKTLGMPAIFMISLGAGLLGVALTLGVREPENASRVPRREKLSSQARLFRNPDILRFSLLTAVSQMLSFAVPVTFTPLAAAALGADETVLSLLQMVYVLAVAVSCLFVGSRAYRRIGGIATLSASFLLGAASCVPVFYANLPLIFCMQILSGACYGVTLAALSGFVVRSASPSQRTAALGVFESLYSIGIFFGPALAGFLEDALSFSGAYWAFFGLALAGAALCPALIPRKYNRMG